MSVKEDRFENLQEKLADLHLSADYCTKCLDELEGTLKLGLENTKNDGLGELKVLISTEKAGIYVILCVEFPNNKSRNI